MKKVSGNLREFFDSRCIYSCTYDILHITEFGCIGVYVFSVTHYA